MAASAYVILGLGARGAGFRGRRYPLPNGWIDWIRARDERWGPDGKRPVTVGEIKSLDDIRPEPPEWTEEWLDLCPDAGRFVVHVTKAKPWASRLEAAYAVVDFVLAYWAFSLPLDLDWTVAPIPAATVRQREVVLQELDPDPDHGWRFDWEHLALTTSYSSDDEIDDMFGICDAVFRDGDVRTHGVFPAMIYHRLSALEYGFAPDDVKRLIGRHDLIPETPFHRARAEEAFHNAYKGVEAVLGGQPPKHARRLRGLLASRGVDADQAMAFPIDRDTTIMQRLARLRQIRDQRTAHGGRSPSSTRHLTYHDLIEAQWVVAALIKLVLDGMSSHGPRARH